MGDCLAFALQRLWTKAKRGKYATDARRCQRGADVAAVLLLSSPLLALEIPAPLRTPTCNHTLKSASLGTPRYYQAPREDVAPRKPPPQAAPSRYPPQDGGTALGHCWSWEPGSCRLPSSPHLLTLHKRDPPLRPGAWEPLLLRAHGQICCRAPAGLGRAQGLTRGHDASSTASLRGCRLLPRYSPSATRAPCTMPRNL